MRRPTGRPLRAWAAALGLLTVLGLGLTGTAGSAGSAHGAVTSGEELFGANCAVCHGLDAQGSRSAPALGGVVERLGRDTVEATIRDGRGGMPSFAGRLTEEEIGAVAGFLQGLPSTAATGRPRGHMWGNGMMRGWGWPAAVLWLLLGAALIVLVVVVVVRRDREGPSG